MMTCRICLIDVEPSKGVNVFTKWRKDELISDMIMNFAYVEVFDDDEITKIICPLCLERLKFVYKFKHLIIKSDTQLRKKQVALVKNDETVNLHCNSEQSGDDELSVQCSSPAFVKCEQNPNCNSVNVTADHEESQYIAQSEGHKNEENLKEIVNTIIKNVRTTSKNNYKCDQCQNVFKNRYNLKVHKTTHTGILPYRCEVCNKGFILQYMLNVHKRIHSDERPFKCDYCEKSFKSKSVLITHCKIHQGIKAYLCKTCGKAFSQVSNLQAHQNVHTRLRFVCEVCGKDYSSKTSLDRHFAKVHMNEPNEPCPVCGKLYYNLQKHIKTIHSEARTRFPCAICDKKFASKGVLKIHQRIHDGVKPYSCDICGKRFTQACVARLHRRVHTRETPFPCEACDRQFAYKHHLKKHIERDHPHYASSCN